MTQQIGIVFLPGDGFVYTRQIGGSATLKQIYAAGQGVHESQITEGEFQERTCSLDLDLEIPTFTFTRKGNTKPGEKIPVYKAPLTPHCTPAESNDPLTCEDCQWFVSCSGMTTNRHQVSMSHGGVCHKYPQEVIKESWGWCAEFEHS